MATSSGLSVRWEVFDAEEKGDESDLFSQSWNVFLSAITGHRVFVLPYHRDAGTWFVLDLIKKEWRLLHPSGDIPRHVTGSSLVTCADRLIIIDGRVHRLKTIKVFDTVLKEWRKRPVTGDTFFPVAYHVADFWEAQRLVLINSREAKNESPNPTYKLDVDTMQMQRVNTKGPPPSRRHYHSSFFLDVQEKWIIFCGQGPEALLCDVCILDFRCSIPTWTRTTPFAELRGMSVCSPVMTGSRLLLLGGIRRGLLSSTTCSYDTHNGHVQEGVEDVGAAPPNEQFSFQRILQTNNSEFIFIAARKRTGMQRVYRGEIV